MKSPVPNRKSGSLGNVRPDVLDPVNKMLPPDAAGAAGLAVGRPNANFDSTDPMKGICFCLLRLNLAKRCKLPERSPCGSCVIEREGFDLCAAGCSCWASRIRPKNRNASTVHL